MITKEHFERFWKESYGDTPPIGYILRNRFFSDRWFRIHSLPDSKRDADDDNELQTLLDRQNTLINDLIGNHHDFLLLFSQVSNTPMPMHFLEIPNTVDLDSIRLDIILPEDFEDESYLSMSFVNKKWKSGSINTYLEQMANEGRIIDINNCCHSYALLIIDMGQNRMIAPYDGGVDIFLNTKNERDTFKAKYKEWISSTESGL